MTAIISAHSMYCKCRHLTGFHTLTDRCVAW